LFKRIIDFLKVEAVRHTLHYYLLFIYLGLSAGVSGPTLPVLAEQTGIRLGQMGYIFLLSALGYTLGTLLGGRLLDRFRGHPVLGLGQVISGVLIMLIPVVPWFWLLLLVFLVKGVTDGLLNGVNTLLVWTHGEKAAPFMNALHFFFGLGAFIGPLFVANLINIPLGYRWVYWGLGIYAVLVGLKVLLLPGSPKPAHTHNKSNEVSMRAFYPMVFVAALYLFFYVGAEITYGGWIYTYSTTLKIFDVASAAYLNSGFWLSFTLGRFISIPLGIRFKPAQIIPAALAGCLSILVVVLMLPSSPALLWVLTVVLGFCMAPLWPMGFTLAGQSIKLTARFSSIVLLGDSLGGMFLPWLVGQVIDVSGAGSMIPIVLVAMIFNMLTFIVLIKMKRPAMLEA
jgi:MFS transporter, FHS family, Na+ dependent glucose transporter 1